ncbi:MAG TPA: response regulator, partial [Clostridia bacterium]|nr:response regulator [Clostridia bacterium]
MKKAVVLIIEDDYDIRNANRAALELEGYRVYEADSLARGRSIAAEISPDLVILDILLPDGNGLYCCKELREKSDVRILLLSALNTKTDVLAGLRAGGDDYISKPYDMDELILRVKTLLRRGRLIGLEE